MSSPLGSRSAIRFDNERAAAWAERFASTGAEGTEREGRLADAVAEEFTRIGLRSESRVVLGSRFPHQILPALGWCALCLGMTLATYLSDHGVSGVLRATAVIGAIVGWGIATFPGLRFGHGWPPRVASRNVLAARAVDGSPPARLIFRTPLDGIGVRGPEVPWWASSVTVGVLVVTLLVSYRERGWALPVLVLLWVHVLVRSVPFLKSARDPGLRENRTGLAVLLELARSWPRRADGRIEAHFVALGGQGLDGAGSWALEATIRDEWPIKPTLIIDLSAPGVGKGLILSARGHAELAGSAAADLWIPHRLARRHVWTTWARPVSKRDDDVVWLIGDEAFDRSNHARETTIAPEALGRAAQLATEIALRWARRVATASPESR